MNATSDERSCSPAMKLRQPLAWLFASSLLVAAACAGDDQPASAAPGAGGAAGEGGQGGLAGAELEQLRDICARVAAHRDYLYLTNHVCEQGTRLHHNQVIPPGEDEIPVSKAPRAYDSGFFETCLDFVFDPYFACWQEGAAWHDCLAEDVLYCDDTGYWNYSEDCGPFDFAHVCTE